MEILYQIQYGPLADRAAVGGALGAFPLLELQPETGPGVVENIAAGRPPRGLKTHLHADFFKRNLDNPESNVRFVVLLRNPKDILISMYHFQKASTHYQLSLSFNELFERFRSKQLVFGSSIDFSQSWWKHRDHPRVHIMTYEDLVNDAPKNVRALASFLGYNLCDSDMTGLLHETSLSAMRARGISEYVPPPFNTRTTDGSAFFRKGMTGDWREYLSQEQSGYVDELVREQLNSQGFYFKHK